MPNDRKQFSLNLILDHISITEQSIISRVQHKNGEDKKQKNEILANLEKQLNYINSIQIELNREYIFVFHFYHRSPIYSLSSQNCLREMQKFKE